MELTAVKKITQRERSSFGEQIFTGEFSESDEKELFADNASKLISECGCWLE